MENEIRDVYNTGWLPNGEWKCPKCHTQIGKNLLDERPFACAFEHAKQCVSELVGFLVNIGDKMSFLCEDCVQHFGIRMRANARIIPVHRVNIGVYSQVCAECDKVVIDGAKSYTGAPLCLF